MPSIQSLIHSPLFWTYFTLFTLLILIKKLRHLTVAINGIWFSADGSVPDDAINNFTQLATDIKKSPYRKNYQLFFWTDTKKLHPKIKKQFKKHGIKIKDYRQVTPTDEAAKTANQWVKQLLQLGNENNKLFYVLASDIFRLYLLLKEFPRQYSYSFACYIDCNDINLNHIPNPRTFVTLPSLAFHFVAFGYQHHDIFAKLIDCPKETQWLLTNDVILTANKKAPIIFDRIFESFYSNLNNIHYSGKNIIEILKNTRDVMSVVDDSLVKVIIFSTTHMINTLHAEIEKKDKIFLLNYVQHQIQKNPIEIYDVEYYIDFERHYDKGLTWLKRKLPPAEVQAENAQFWREFWYQLFIQRYTLLTLPTPD